MVETTQIIKQEFDFGDEEFYGNLDNFIMACLKEYSVNGSLTKTQLKQWFNDRIDLRIIDYDRLSATAEL